MYNATIKNFKDFLFSVIPLTQLESNHIRKADVFWKENDKMLEITSNEKDFVIPITKDGEKIQTNKNEKVDLENIKKLTLDGYALKIFEREEFLNFQELESIFIECHEHEMISLTDSKIKKHFPFEGIKTLSLCFYASKFLTMKNFISSFKELENLFVECDEEKQISWLNETSFLKCGNYLYKVDVLPSKIQNIFLLDYASIILSRNIFSKLENIKEIFIDCKKPEHIEWMNNKNLYLEKKEYKFPIYIPFFKKKFILEKISTNILKRDDFFSEEFLEKTTVEISIKEDNEEKVIFSLFLKDFKEKNINVEDCKISFIRKNDEEENPVESEDILKDDCYLKINENNQDNNQDNNQINTQAAANTFTSVTPTVVNTSTNAGGVNQDNNQMKNFAFGAVLSLFY